MSNFRSVILGPLDIVRGVGGLLGLRVFTVTIVVRTWSGDRVGLGQSMDTPRTALTNKLPNGVDTTPVRVRQLSRREIIASGGLYSDRDVRVGPITPPYPAGLFGSAGGFDESTVDPAQTASYVPTEVFWNVVGPGWPTGTGGWADKIGEETTALHTYAILRANGRLP